MVCCCTKKEEDKWAVENFTDGALLRNRSCTDCPCIIAFLVFIAGWVVLMAVAFVKGHPERILLPANYRGELCGEKDSRLENYPNYFAPLPNRPTYGFCVPSCPDVPSYVCNNDLEPMIGNASVLIANHYYSHSQAEFNEGKDAVMTCQGSCTAAEEEKARRFAALIGKMSQNKCFLAFYSTSETLYRCIPVDLGTENKTFLEQANATFSVLKELTDQLGVGSFFVRGFAECDQTWRVILITSFTAVVMSLIWVFLLRWILAPIVFLCIALVFAVFIIIGVLAMLQADDLDKVALPGETGTSDQVKVWRAIEYTSFILAALYVVIMLFLIKRIRIAIILMEESSKSFLANPILVILPIIVMILLIGFAALFVVSTIFIQTMDNVNYEYFHDKVVDFIGAENINRTELAVAAGYSYVEEIYGGNISNPLNLTVPYDITNFNSTQAMKGLHAFNFFMFLWVGNFWVMFSFFIMALVISTWYFSATTMEMDDFDKGNGGRLKSTAMGTFCRSIWVSIRYHLGTIIFGALVIAIIQFIRAVVLYIEKQYLQKWKDNATMKAAICCLNCCLMCIEKLVRAISKSAFVVTCVSNEGFCCAAAESLGIMISNIVQTGTLQGLSIVACLVLKVFITVTNLMIAYGLMFHVPYLTEDRTVESGLFPMFFIALISLAIACLFVNIYESCIDTIMMCFFMDEKRFGGKFMPPSLSKLVGAFSNIEKARKEYHDQQRKAVAEM